VSLDLVGGEGTPRSASLPDAYSWIKLSCHRQGCHCRSVYKKTDRASEGILELQELRHNLQKLRKPAMREPFVHLCSEGQA
jgi:hypothetical protein